MKKIMSILVILIASPIWYYLLYKILSAINASELMWFLYWIYIPVGIISLTISNIIKKEGE